MKEFVQSIPWMYFNAIRDGKVSAIFFKKAQLDTAKEGDLITLSFLDEKVKVYFEDSVLMSFSEVDDDLVERAGFASKDLLEDHLISRFNLNTYHFKPVSSIEDEIFCVVSFNQDPVDKIVDDGEVKMKMVQIPGTMAKMKKKDDRDMFKVHNNYTYKNTTDIVNPEYYEKPWRN